MRSEKFKIKSCRLPLCHKPLASKGFTLVELLIVMAVLSILVTIGLQSFSGTYEKSRDSQRKSDLNQIQKALELYKQDQSPWAYPDIDTTGGDAWSDFQTALETDGYMKAVPADPGVTKWAWPNYNFVRDAGDTLGYTMYACLENLSDSDRDDVDGGAGDLCTLPNKGVSYTVTEP